MPTAFRDLNRVFFLTAYGVQKRGRTWVLPFFLPVGYGLASKLGKSGLTMDIETVLQQGIEAANAAETFGVSTMFG